MTVNVPDRFKAANAFWILYSFPSSKRFAPVIPFLNAFGTPNGTSTSADRLWPESNSK